MEKFTFNPLTEDDLNTYIEEANVFNMVREEIETEKIVLNSFSDERLGSSEEKLDVAVYYKGNWKLLDIEDKIKDFNEMPVQYLVDGHEYTRVLIIIRRMSTMVLDTVTGGATSYIYCCVPERYKNIEEDKPLFGLLAKSQIFLDEDEDSIKRQIKKNIIDRNEEICSRLFQ